MVERSARRFTPDLSSSHALHPGVGLVGEGEDVVDVHMMRAMLCKRNGKSQAGFKLAVRSVQFWTEALTNHPNSGGLEEMPAIQTFEPRCRTGTWPMMKPRSTKREFHVESCTSLSPPSPGTSRCCPRSAGPRGLAACSQNVNMVLVCVKASPQAGDAFTQTRLMATFGVSAGRSAEGPKVGFWGSGFRVWVLGFRVHKTFNARASRRMGKGFPHLFTFLFGFFLFGYHFVFAKFGQTNLGQNQDWSKATLTKLEQSLTKKILASMACETAPNPDPPPFSFFLSLGVSARGIVVVFCAVLGQFGLNKKDLSRPTPLQVRRGAQVGNLQGGVP